ncbi:MAG TPA: hypothetical protein VMZ06_04425 [Candidatus Bathyarchaeia archaeon]|nr:hypothetical protein [Candidatus Bathyarchaeia archaeon]
MKLLLAVTMILTNLAAWAASLEPVGQPCRAKNVLAGCVVTDRATGREQFVVSNSSEEAGLELIFIDPDANTGRVFRAPAGQGSWCIREVPGDRLVISTYYDGKFLVFDLNTMQFTQALQVPGESYVWDVAIGSDGRVYGGTYPGGKLAAMDLNTYAVEVCGAPAPPNMYLRNVSSTKDGRIICNFGMEAPVTLVYDPAAKTFSPVTDADKKGDEAVTAVAEVDLRGGRVLAADGQGRLLGIRGQDYFVLKSGDKDLALRPFPVESAPRPLMFLNSDPQGRLWSGPHFGQTLCWLDPETKEFGNTACVCDSGGEIFDVAFAQGLLFTVSYAGGDITKYDPSQPWDQWNNKNPKGLAHLATRGFIRPVAGIHLAPDGKLYSGWMGKYGAYSGAIAITDPETGETDLIENPLGEKTINGLCVDDTRIYASTSLGANGLPAKPNDTPSFGVFDIKTREKLHERIFQGAHDVRIYGKTGNLVVVVAAGKLHFFDAAKSEWLAGLPDNLPRLASNSAVLQGRVLWYGSGKSLVRLDLDTWKFEPVAETPDSLRNVAITPNGTVYVSSGSTVYRLNQG